MAATGSRHADHLIDDMVSDAARYDFNQAVRLIYRIAAHADPDRGKRLGRLGSDDAPASEPLRFHCHPMSRFPAASLHAIKRRDEPAPAKRSADAADASPPAPATPPRFDLSVLFAGLTGPNGALPRHFTTMLVEQRRENNLALEQFQDLFNHRLISLMHRAWQKNHFPAGMEEAEVFADAKRDTFTRCLQSLVGLGLDSHRSRMSIDDRTAVFFSRHYARRVPTLDGIRRTLADYFQADVEIEQFVGAWMTLDTADRSCLGNAARPEGQNMALGVNTVMGERIWYSQSRFRIRMGPLTYDQYRQYLPDRPAMRQLCELVRLHVGPEYEFDMVPILLGSEVPGCKLGGDDAPRLGWTTFLATQPRNTDFDEARFERPDI